MHSDYLSRAQRALEQAQHFIALAEKTADPEVHQQLLSVAHSYERMSQQFLELFAGERTASGE
jgi:hypothetical protein